MGILYLNLVNSLLGSGKYNNSLVFSIVNYSKSKSSKKPKTEYDDLYYVSLSDLFKFLHVKDNIIFKQPHDKFIETFDVIVDGQSKTINTSSIIHLSKHIIKFIDNKDLPINNNKRMHHSPFIIYNNCNVKLPNSSILSFNSSGILQSNWENLKSETHATYHLITSYLPSLTLFSLSQSKLSYSNFKPSSTDISIFKSLILIQK